MLLWRTAAEALTRTWQYLDKGGQYAGLCGGEQN